MRIKIIFLLCYCISLAQGLTTYSKQNLSFHTENDVYFPPTDFDRYYTTGTNFTYTSKEFKNSALRYIGIFSLLQDSKLSRFSIGINQEIHTPDNKENIIPPKDDALYGGYLYGNFGVHHRTQNFLESLSLDIGVVGKYSFAQETQDFIHTLLNLNTMRGWDSQLNNEVIINLYHRLLYRFSIIPNVFELLPYSEIALGNAYTHLGVGLNLRLGYGLQNDFGITTIHSGNVGSASFGDGLRLYLAAGINERAIGRNIFLQGNTFGGVKSSLNINHLIYEANIGILIGYYGWSVSYLYVYRQKEFSTQKAPLSYGAIRLEISF